MRNRLSAIAELIDSHLSETARGWEEVYDTMSREPTTDAELARYKEFTANIEQTMEPLIKEAVLVRESLSFVSSYMGYTRLSCWHAVPCCILGLFHLWWPPFVFGVCHGPKSRMKCNRMK